MTALVRGTKSMASSILVGFAMATGRMNKTLERIGTQRAAQTLACYGHYDIAKNLYDSLEEGK